MRWNFRSLKSLLLHWVLAKWVSGAICLLLISRIHSLVVSPGDTVRALAKSNQDGDERTWNILVFVHHILPFFSDSYYTLSESA
jgi:phosphate/sulfate permease